MGYIEFLSLEKTKFHRLSTHAMLHSMSLCFQELQVCRNVSMTKPNRITISMLWTMIFAVMIMAGHLCTSSMSSLQAITMPKRMTHLFWRNIVIPENREAVMSMSVTPRGTLKTLAMTRSQHMYSLRERRDQKISYSSTSKAPSIVYGLIISRLIQCKGHDKR